MGGGLKLIRIGKVVLDHPKADNDDNTANAVFDDLYGNSASFQIASSNDQAAGY
jgi:hypothetical protein